MDDFKIDTSNKQDMDKLLEYPVKINDPQLCQPIIQDIPASIGKMKTVRKVGLGLNVLSEREVHSMLMETMKVSHIGYDDLSPQVKYENPVRAVALSRGYSSGIGKLHDLVGVPEEFDRTYIVQAIHSSETRNVRVSPEAMTVQDLEKPVQQGMVDVFRGMDRDTLEMIRDSKDGFLRASDSSFKDVQTIVGCEGTSSSLWVQMASLACELVGYGQTAKLIVLKDPERDMLGKRRNPLLRDTFLSEDGSPLLYIFRDNCGWVDVLDDMSAESDARYPKTVWCQMTAGASVKLEKAYIRKLTKLEC